MGWICHYCHTKSSLPRTSTPSSDGCKRSDNGKHVWIWSEHSDRFRNMLIIGPVVLGSILSIPVKAQYMPVPRLPQGCYYVWSQREHRQVMICEERGRIPRIYR